MQSSRFMSAMLVICALALTGCANTVRGIGKDVKSTAHAVQDAVK